MKKIQDKILITGHKNPDTDSICSAIAYADFKIKNGFEAVPIRLGNISKETKFALDYFGVDEPVLFNDITPKVADLDFDKPKILTADDSLAKAWKIFEAGDLKTIGIVDKYNHLLGCVTISDITKSYINIKSLRNKKIPKKNLESVLDAKVIVGDFDKLIIKGKIHVAAMSPEAMYGYIRKGDVLIVGNRKDTQLKALETEVACLIVTGGHTVCREIINKAKEKNIIVMVSSKPTFNVSRLLLLTLPVGEIMTSFKDLVTCNIEEFVNDIKSRMVSKRFASFPIIDAQRKLVGFISRFHLVSPKRRKIILVDHNEKSQSIKGLEFAEILEIVDHHRIGGIHTNAPIIFNNAPVGCSATIITEKFLETKTKLEKNIAGLLLSAIISDTLILTSPTTTDRDKKAVKYLSKVAEVDFKKYALKLLKAGTSIKGLSPEELFYSDFKILDINKYHFGFAQINTMDFDSLNNIKNELTFYMKKKCKVDGFDGLILVLTNILEGNSEIYFDGSASFLVREAFNLSDNSKHAYLPGIVSRKKQIIPKISSVIEN